jgi:hypothetical protein
MGRNRDPAGKIGRQAAVADRQGGAASKEPQSQSAESQPWGHDFVEHGVVEGGRCLMARSFVV